MVRVAKGRLLLVLSLTFYLLPFAFTSAQQQAKYDLLLHGGHVIDARNKISDVRDVAIAGGKIAAVEATIDPADALKTVDVTGLYVTPGLVDIHAHTYTGHRGARFLRRRQQRLS